jgi:Zn finger protein HypA/HybF involved in hydrogenase expression
MNVPKRLQSNLKLRKAKEDNLIICGDLICCDQHEFEVAYSGILRKSLMSNYYLQDQTDGMSLTCKCKKCGEELVVFNSNTDGYDNCINTNDLRLSNPPQHVLDCPKCSSNEYTIKMKYEYLDKSEIKDEGIKDYENSFTWIWVSLRCITCNKEFKKFIDYETA